jgi:hypothetical protein
MTVYIFAGMDPNGADGSMEELPLHAALRVHHYYYYTTNDSKARVVELLIKVSPWKAGSAAHLTPVFVRITLYLLLMLSFASREEPT